MEPEEPPAGDGLALGLGAAVVVAGLGSTFFSGLSGLSAFGLGETDGLADGDGVALPPLPPVAVSLPAADADEDADGVAVGVSVWETQGPALNLLLGISSAWARCGVKPMPIRTAVGIAASATAFPAGTCSLISSDLRGAA